MPPMKRTSMTSICLQSTDWCFARLLNGWDSHGSHDTARRLKRTSPSAVVHHLISFIVEEEESIQCAGGDRGERHGYILNSLDGAVAPVLRAVPAHVLLAARPASAIFHGNRRLGTHTRRVLFATVGALPGRSLRSIAGLLSRLTSLETALRTPALASACACTCFP